MTTNCIKFESVDIETAKGVGSISTLTFDIDFTVEPITSDNPMAPTHRDTSADYFTMSIRDFGFNANLGKAANQDDDTVQAVIPWGPKDAQ